MTYSLAILGNRPLRSLGGWNNPQRSATILSKMHAHILDVLGAHPHDLRILTTLSIGPSTDAAALANVMKIPFHCYLPFPSYTDRWPLSAKAVWEQYLGRAASSEWVSLGPPAPYKYHKANRKIIDLCDEAYIVWDGQDYGGTWEALNYANALQIKNNLEKPAIHIHALWTENEPAYGGVEPAPPPPQPHAPYAAHVDGHWAADLHWDEDNPPQQNEINEIF